jgi:hypothetical protein
MDVCNVHAPNCLDQQELEEISKTCTVSLPWSSLSVLICQKLKQTVTTFGTLSGEAEVQLNDQVEKLCHIFLERTAYVTF